MKKKKNNNIKKIVTIIACVFLVFILVISLMVRKILKQRNQEKVYTSISDFENLEELLEYSDCEFISSGDSKDEDCKIDIYVHFPVDPIDGEKSNEVYYSNLIKRVSDFIDYNSFRIIDEQKDLTVKVICDNEIRSIMNVYINGEEDYFKKRVSSINLTNYKETKITNFAVKSRVIQDLIQNDWSTQTDFGTKESDFDKYEVYFDEGIKVRKIAGKVYNVVFTSRYNNEVIDDIKVGTTLGSIKEKYGDPTYGDVESNLIGYKGKDIYIFFTENEISVYKVCKDDFSEFNELVNKYTEDKDILSFMDSLTDLWPDYSDYKYDTDYLYIVYPTRGIKIEYNYSEEDGIKVYNEFLDNSTDINKDGDIVIKNTGLMRETENIRCTEYNDFGYYASWENKEKPKSNKFYSRTKNYTNGNIEKIQFKSIDGENPDFEFEKQINSYVWINDTIIAYSIKNKGIYLFDCITKEERELLTGENEFELKGFDNNILKYDDTELEVN